MGTHVWVLIATIGTECLVVFKWSKGQFEEPFPTSVKVGWAVVVCFVTGYPLYKFGVPKARRYLRREGRRKRE